MHEDLGPDRLLAGTKLVAEEESGACTNVAKGRIQGCCYSRTRQASGEQWAEAWVDKTSDTAAGLKFEGFVDDSMIPIESVNGFFFVDSHQHQL